MMRARLRIEETDDVATVREKITAGAERVALEEEEAVWLAPRLRVLLGGGDRSAFDRNDLFSAWGTFLARVGGESPVVLVFEDAQHADSGLLDLVEHLARTSKARLLVVVITRPELLERRASLLESRSAALVDLPPLAAEAMGSLVDGLVDGLPTRARRALVARSDGVPLYAVETVRSWVDREAVVPRDGRYVFVDHDHSRVDLDRLTAPTSLRMLIAARLDTLGAVERRMVQDASVLGLVFRIDQLQGLTDAVRRRCERR